MADSQSAALRARAMLLFSRRQLLDARSANLTLRRSLLQNMTTAVRIECEILEKERRALEGEEKLVGFIRSAGLKEDFTLSDVEVEDSAAGPPEPKRRRTDRYRDLVAEAQVELLAKMDARDAVRAELAATDSRIGALLAERRAAEEECERGEALLREFACAYMSPVRKLPVEMLRKIFSHLRPEDLITAGQVCSAWRAVLREGSTWKDSPYEIIDYDYDHPNTFPRILKAAPRLGTVVSACCTEWPVPSRTVEIDLLLLRTTRLGHRGAPSVLKHYGGWIRRLRLAVYYKHTAQMIDTKAASLEELSVNFKCSKPHIFKGRFVRQSTLVTLRCWDVPAETLTSIINGHSATLEEICLRASAKALPLPGSAINAALESCPRLRTLQVECRTVGLQVPARCSELVLVVGGCPPQGCPGCQWLGLTSLTRLHLVTRTTPAPAAPQEDSARPLSWLLGHVRQLDPRFLRALGQLSLRCPCRRDREQHPEQFAQLERLTRDCGSVRIGGVTEEDRIFESFSSVDCWSSGYF